MSDYRQKPSDERTVMGIQGSGRESEAARSLARRRDRSTLDVAQTDSDSDQTAADSDQTAADADQTASDSDQIASDSDQVASDSDQANADQAQADDAQRPDRVDYERSRTERAAAAQERQATSIARARTSATREPLAQLRDQVATRRDAQADAARDRARAADDRAHAALGRTRLERALASAHLDDLTGAYRREMGRLALSHEIARARRGDGRFVLAFVDVDDLKAINDCDGHPAGDTALRSVAEAMRARLRPFDPIIRYGGDEFVAGLGGTDVEEVEQRFDAIKSILAGAGVAITVGLARLEGEETADELVARADHALYRQRRHT